MAARVKVDYPPARAGLRHNSDLQRTEKSGSNQRGFAAAGRSKHCEETRPGQQVNHLVDATLATEKQVALISMEGAKAWVWDAPSGKIGHRMTSAMMSCTGCKVNWRVQSISRASGMAMSMVGFGLGGHL